MNSSSKNTSLVRRTIVALDLVGYSHFARTLEQLTDATVVQHFNDRIQRFVDDGLHDVGCSREEVVKGTAGDSALLVFERASEAHQFAAAVHRSTAQHNSALKEPAHPLNFRIGIATGRIGVRGQEISGTRIIDSVRFEAAGKRGHILIDEATYEELPAKWQKCYRGPESISDKQNNAYPVYRFAVVESDAPVATAESARARKASAESPPLPARAPANPLRVLVVGSLNQPRRKAERQQFHTACRHLGAALARRGLTLVVSSLHPNTADVPVLEGANEAREGLGHLPVVLWAPSVPRANDPLYPGNEREFQATFPHLSLTLEMLAGDWAEIREAQAREADVVILLGGREGTRQVAWAAKKIGVPIVPVPIFGRAAKHLWELERAELAAAKRFTDAEAFSKLYDKFNAEQIADLALRFASARKATR